MRNAATVLLILWVALWPSRATAHDVSEAPTKMRLSTKIALACFSVGSYFDAIQTAHCSALGTCHEANWLYRGMTRRRGIVFTMTVKGAANTALAAGVIHDSKRHPRRAFWSALGLCGAQAAADIANARTLERTAR